MDGHQFLVHARLLCPDMPVLLMSGHTDEAEMKRTLEEGAAAVLYEPLDRDEVVIRIREAPARRRHPLWPRIRTAADPVSCPFTEATLPTALKRPLRGNQDGVSGSLTARTPRMIGCTRQK